MNVPHQAMHLVCNDDEMEALDAALLEIGMRFAEHEIERGRMLARIEELRGLKSDLRRKRARNKLDAFLPPLILALSDMECVGPTQQERGQGEQAARATNPRAA
jgi:hypothetical protein